MAFENCSFCDRKGLLLYPVRYAVACPAGAATAPGLRGNFKIENAPTEIATAKYTLRAIRTGYLYTYDEKRDRLKGYLVLPGGYLWNFPLDLPAPGLRSRVFTCTRPSEEALSMFVDVMHSQQDPARVLWIGWSNTAWTPELIKKVKDDEWRRRHMRGVDIPWMLKGLRDVHVGEFEKNYEAVAHFVMSKDEMKKAFGFSNMPISHETGRKDKLEKFRDVFKIQTVMNRGYIVALDDPVGIANDLSELTVPTDHSGFDVELYRGRIIDEILQSAESAVRQRARSDFDFNVKQRKIDDKNPVPDGVSYSDSQEMWEVIKAGGPARLEKRRQAERKKYGASVAGQRKAAEDAAWTELTTLDSKPILDAKKRAALPERYNAAVKAFEKQGLALAQAHADWLASKQLARWMEGVHDASDLSSGFAYRESLAQCVGKATATNACDKQLSAWLKSADASNTRNLYARAMLFNQNEIIKAAEPQIKGGDVKMKNLLSVYKQAADRLKKGEELRLIDRLVFTTTNSMLKALGQGAHRAMRDLTLMSLSLLSKTVIKPSNRSPREIADWMLAEAKSKGIQFDTGVLQTRSDALQAARKIPNVRSPDPAICAYELDTLQLEQDGRVTPESVKRIKIPGYELTTKWFGSSAEFNKGSVAVVLQLAAFAFAYRDHKISDKFENEKYLAKLGIAVLSLGGALVELTGNVMEKAPSHPLSVAIHQHWAKGPETGKKILLTGKRLGLFAGISTALFDLYEAYLSHQDGEDGLATLYAVNGVLGMSLAIASYFSAAVFWPLFFAALILSIVIALLKKSALKKWFAHCFFAPGYSIDTGYRTLDEELIALNSALGA